jgi:hypothetical protein
MIAMWVGQKVINEARVGILTLPSSDTLKQKSNTLGRDWYVEVSQEETGNRHINKIEVQVFTSEHEEASPLITLESYIYGG